MQGIQCCFKCVAPKRHLGCHGTCKEYKEARAAVDAEKVKKEEMRKKEALVSSVRRGRRG